MLYNDDALTLRVLSVNRMTWRKKVATVAPRAFGALVYRMKGSAVFHVGREMLEVRAGDILYIPSGTGYEVEYSDTDMIAIHFAACSYAAGVEVMRFSDTAYFYSRFMEILHSWQTTGSVYLVNALVYRLLDDMRRNAGRVEREDTAFSLCVAAIRERIADPLLSVADICARYSVSEATLRRKFHRYFALSPKQYILQLRLSLALRLLTESTKTVAEVGVACGFSDEKYFSRVVKAAFGEAPSVLRGHLRA